MDRRNDVPGLRRIGPNHWELRVRIQNQTTGQRMQVKRRFRGTRKQALAELQRLQAELREGEGGVERTREEMTLGGCARWWIEFRRGRGEHHSTRRCKVQVLQAHILPHFGEWFVQAIRRAQVHEWLQACQAKRVPRTGKPYVPVTINYWLHVLQAMVGAAYREFEWGPSPLKGIEPLYVPRRSEDDPNCLTAEQIGPFLDEVARRYPRQHAMLFLGFTTGLRWSELSALHWGDLDEARGLLHIRRGQVDKHVDRPKTESSYRTLGLVPAQIDVLRAHRRWLIEQQHPGLERGLVFPSSTGTYSATSRVAKALRVVAEAQGIPHRITTKAMRRTFNNLLRQQHIDRQVLWSLTGHSSEQMTGVYSTVEAREQQDAVGHVVRLVGTR